MNRLFFSGVTLFLVGIFSLSIQAIEKPNIIYILADDLGYGDLGCYGQEVIQTPHLDKMADEGMRFTRHHAGSSICGPSRACLLEGKHSGHTYMRGNGGLQFREDPNDLIFPRPLQQAGYHTAMIGKSGLGCNTDDASLPYKKGFDYFFGIASAITKGDHYYTFRISPISTSAWVPQIAEIVGGFIKRDLWFMSAGCRRR